MERPRERRLEGTVPSGGNAFPCVKHTRRLFITIENLHSWSRRCEATGNLKAIKFDTHSDHFSLIVCEILVAPGATLKGDCETDGGVTKPAEILSFDK